jgi:hypothetical protein
MEIHQHYADDGSRYITVEEALPVELIATEIFEAPQGGPWLRVDGFEDNGHTVHGTFAVQARNGTWVYRFTRRIWWLNDTYEAKLIQGQVLRNPVETVSSGPRAAAVEPAGRTWLDPACDD